MQKVYFSSDLNIKGRGLILRHVLEHVEDPVSFLFELAAANGNEGLIYIEVPVWTGYWRTVRGLTCSTSMSTTFV